jgi:hypothetical protein
MIVITGHRKQQKLYIPSALAVSDAAFCNYVF